jgi:hypothetical protein
MNVLFSGMYPVGALVILGQKAIQRVLKASHIKRTLLLNPGKLKMPLVRGTKDKILGQESVSVEYRL